jgi:hypothetical protein
MNKGELTVLCSVIAALTISLTSQARAADAETKKPRQEIRKEIKQDRQEIVQDRKEIR